MRSKGPEAIENDKYGGSTRSTAETCLSSFDTASLATDFYYEKHRNGREGLARMRAVYGDSLGVRKVKGTMLRERLDIGGKMEEIRVMEQIATSTAARFCSRLWCGDTLRRARALNCLNPFE